MRFVVTKNFQDKFTREYYGIGSIYETEDENRSADLENGGYIAQDNTEAAATARASQVAQGNAEAAEVAKSSEAIQESAEVTGTAGSKHVIESKHFSNKARANKKDPAAE